MTNDIVGYLVCWCFEQPKIKREAFNQLCRQKDLPLIPQPKPSSAMTATLDQCRKGLKDRFWHISRIKTVGVKKYYGIYQYNRDQEWDDLKIEQVAVIEFDYKTGELTCDWPHPSFQRIKRLYEYYCTMISYSDILEWSAKVLSYTSAVNIREHGGLYFVPCHDEKIIMAFYDVVNSVPGKCYADCIPQVSSTELKKVISRFLKPFVDRIMLVYRDWASPVVKVALIKYIDKRLRKFRIFRRLLVFYGDLIDFPSKPYIQELDRIIYMHKVRREDSTFKQGTYGKHNKEATYD